MTSKSLAILAAVAVVLIALVFVTKKKEPQQQFEDTAQTISDHVFFKGVKPENVAKLRIEHPGSKPVELERDAAGPWQVRTPGGLRPVDGGRQTTISKDGEREEFTADQKGFMQAEKADSQKAFGTDKETAIHVSFFDAAGKTLEDLYVGRPSQGSTHTYLRPAASEATYMVPGTLTNNFTGKTILDYRDRRVFNGILPDFIHQIVYNDEVQTTGSYVLNRATHDPKDTNFTIDHDGVTDTARTAFARGATMALTNMWAVDFANLMDGETPDFTTATAKIAFSVNNRPTSVTITLGQESKTQPGHFFMKTSESEDVMLVLPPKGVMRTPQEYIPPPTPTPTPVVEEAAPQGDAEGALTLPDDGTIESGQTAAPPPTPRTTPVPITTATPAGS